ncbi:MAG: cytochrome c biogenesis CcdA family protein [Actinomycetota bacterium]|nr:cytochrome c biogenesis CcdA family protein [Actinomycetota bacterium]
MADPTAPVAFAAGVVSFLSPCVLPIVPGYLSYMTGVEKPVEEKSTLQTGIVALGFVAGFTAVFVALGVSATLLGSFLRDYQREFTQIGGALIIVMGLIFMGVLKVPWLYREARFRPSPKAGFWGSLVLGAAFGFGWSPCIGATLGAVLTMAAGNATAGEGAFLLAVYSLGLGLPFLLAGLGFSRLTGVTAWLRKRTRVLNIASGTLLILVGILFVTDQFFQLSAWMQREFAEANLDFWSSF